MSEILLVILALFILVVSYLLFAPIRIQVDFRVGQKFSAVSTVAMYPFHFSFPLGKKAGEPRTEKPKKPEKQKPPEEPSQFGEKKKFDLSRLNSMDRSLLLETVGEVFRFLGRLLKTPDRYFIKAELSGGAPEPHTTGILYGAYEAARAVLPRAMTLSYSPDFLAEKIEGTVRCGLVIRIATILKEMSLFIFRLPIVRLFKLYRKLK